MSSFNKYSLSVQLTVIFILVFIAVVTTLGIYVYKLQVDNLKRTQLDSMVAISKGVSAAIAEDIYTNNYVSLEQKLLSLNDIIKIDELRIFDDKKTILSELVRRDTNNLNPTYNYGPAENLFTDKFSGFKTDDSMIIREPIIFSGETIAWIEIRTNQTGIQQAKNNIFSELILLSGVILFITLITIIVFLKLRLRSLQELVKFSTELPMAHGDTINIINVPREFELLMRSLNWASKEIERQHNELISKNQSLEERVKVRTKDLEAAKNIAEKANMAKTEFLSRMSHEFRTPMNAVLGFSHLMKMDNSLDDIHRYHINEIIVAGSRLLGLINEILDLSTIEAGTIIMDFDDILISDVIKQALSLIKPIADQDNISLMCDHENKLNVNVRTDAKHLGEVLINILSNAVKYNQSGGKVWLNCNKDTDFFYLHIKDNGIGLTNEQLSVIFEPFNRVGAEKSSVQGTGIGLSISKKLMSLMGGDITIKSQGGTGSCFTIIIPLSEATLNNYPEVLQRSMY